MALLDVINKTCKADDNGHTVKGFHVWFRGYICSPYNDYAVGAALAWPIEQNTNGHPDVGYCAVAGMDSVQMYTKGRPFNVEGPKMPTHETPPAEFVALRDAAMKRLVAYLETL